MTRSARAAGRSDNRPGRRLTSREADRSSGCCVDCDLWDSRRRRLGSEGDRQHDGRRGDSSPRQPRAQQLSGTDEPAAERAVGTTEPAGDLLVFQALQLAEHDGCAADSGQAIDLLVDDPGLLAECRALRDLVRIGPGPR